MKILNISPQPRPWFGLEPQDDQEPMVTLQISREDNCVYRHFGDRGLPRNKDFTRHHLVATAIAFVTARRSGTMSTLVKISYYAALKYE